MEENNKNELSEFNEYDLTPAELRLIQVMLDVGNVGKSVTDICEFAKISRPIYYMAIKKDNFKRALSETAISLVKHQASSIINKSIAVAVSEGAKGFNDRRMLLQMLGLYVSEDKNPNITVNVDNRSIQMSPEERRAKIAELQRKRELSGL